MKHVINVFRFIVFLILSALILFFSFWGLSIGVDYLSTLSLFNVIWIGLIVGLGINGLINIGVIYIAMYVSKFNPYTTIGNWIVVPFAILYFLFSEYVLWTGSDYTNTRVFICNAIFAICTVNLTFNFSMCISKEYNVV